MSEKATRAAYGEALVELGQVNEKVVVLDADLAAATMTVTFKKAFPQRHYDMGIAEANMVNVAAGMSTMGLIPFCSTFAMRALFLVGRLAVPAHLVLHKGHALALDGVGEDGLGLSGLCGLAQGGEPTWSMWPQACPPWG